MATSSSPTILINVVSPNSEVPGRLTFRDVPITETITDLKRRIQDAVSSKPALERQRIIYRGRALVQQDLTLQSILGNEALNNSEPFTFHLVLSPQESQNPPAVLRPDGLHQPLGLPHLSPHIHGARGSIGPPRPASTSQLPEMGQHVVPNISNMPFNPFLNMIPPGLQPGQGVDIRMQFTQNGRPINAPHGVPIPNGMVPGMESGAGILPAFSPEQQLAAIEQQMQAVHQQIHQSLVNRGHNHGANIHQNHHHHHHPANHSANVQHQQHPVGPSQRRPSASPSEATEQVIGGPTPTQQPMPSTSPVNGAGEAIGQSTSTTQIPTSSTPGLASMAVANIHALRQNHIQNMQLDQMNHFAQLRNTLASPYQIPRPSVSSQLTQTVYLLSSPSGPEALLLSPSGNFTSPHFQTTAVTPSLGQNPSLLHYNNQFVAPGHGSRQIPVQRPYIPPNQQQQQQQPQPQPQPQQQQAVQPQQLQNQDQAGDLLRILLPLGGHIWLLVRLIGFVYLFSGGRGWRNTIVLGLLALIGFLAQTGLFNPLIRNVWRPMRQHVEGIINHEHPRPRPADGQEPDPQQMANRLLERPGHRNAIRQAVRRVERSAILFAASLIPGVGESQVRARERAEREQREAEAAAERAREEAEQQAQNEDHSDSKEKDDQVLVQEIEEKTIPSSTAPDEQTQVD